MHILESILSFLTIAVIFLITLLPLVLIHEFGHFIMAKKFGIKVLEFGFGLPPRAIGKKIGETIYSLNWLPFGGFVRLLGEDEVDKKALQDARSFAAQKVWKRIVVVLAGVLMNLFLAWALFYIIIVSNNFKVIVPTVEPIIGIGEIAENSPAQKAGLIKGERILSINNEKIKENSLFIKKVREHAGETITLSISDWSGKNVRNVTAVPRVNPPKGEGALGVAISPFAFMEFKTLPEKIFSAPIYSVEITKLTFQGLGMLFSHLASGEYKQASQNVAGPVGMAIITRDLVSPGIEALLPYLYFIALMSLTLAIFNVLPIPALDGGRLFFLLIEAVIGKKVSPNIEKNVHAVGMFVLIGLILLITYSDISKLFFH